MSNVINSYSSIIDKYKNMINQTESSVASTDDQTATSANQMDSFGNMLSSEMDKLNNQQVQADNLTEDFAAGNTDDLHKVMIASQEASLSMELAVQIRNKMIDAYKELNNMQF